MSRLLSVATGAATFVVRSVLDCLIEDPCRLCARAHQPRRRREATHLLGFAALMYVPLRTRWLGVDVLNNPFCTRCLLGFDEARRAGRVSIEGAGSHERPLVVVSPFMTNDAVLATVHLLKFGRYRELAAPVASAMAAAWRRFDGRADRGTVLVPTPMRRNDIRARGFNQSEIIATAIGQQLQIPVDTGRLAKTRATRRQARTETAHRAANVRAAFGCPAGAFAGRRVVLVDDLLTTGATAAACVEQIESAGAREVTVLCFGRAL